jgi:hypothetical protein
MNESSEIGAIPRTLGEFIFQAIRDSQNLPEAVWYTTLPTMKYVCRLNGLSVKQSGRLVKQVANGRMTVNDVMDHLSGMRKLND